MASDTTHAQLAGSGLLHLTPSVGVTSFLQLLSHSPCAVVTVSPLDAAKLPATVEGGTQGARDYRCVD